MSTSAFSFAGKSDPQVVACLDQSAHARNVLMVAAGLARSQDLPLVLFHVIDPSFGPDNCDPLDWNLRRRQARRYLERLAAELRAPGELAYDIAEGERIHEIARRGHAPGATLVLGTSGESRGPACGRRTAQQALEFGVERVILVPKASISAPLETILVPLDGSGCCETALIEASRLAEQTGASLLLAHVVPPSGPTLFGPPEPADVRLREELDKRNQDSACQFLERKRRQLADRGLEVRSLCLKGDPRSELAQLITEERPGLVVMSTRGQGGRHCGDLSVGSTASYLLAHTDGPMLLLQPADGKVKRHPVPWSESHVLGPTLAA